ncbi:MAG TPA: hypothetical protein VGE66_00525 [Chitinophagaceae bacterium]
MKIRAAVSILLMIVVTSCMKTIASDDDYVDNRSFHNQKVGTSAADLLRDDRYTSLKIEVQYMPGFKPDRAALFNLQLFLFDLLHKPGGIYITTKEIAAAANESLTLDQVVAIERANRTAFVQNDQLTLYILYTNGYFADPKMLGWAYRNTSAVLFGKKIHEHASREDTPDRTILESNILKHEIGHLLGLVNVGSPLQSDHKDHKNGKHCSNPNCLMYYVVDSRKPFRLLLKSEQAELDAGCLEDLRANGGR